MPKANTPTKSLHVPVSVWVATISAGSLVIVATVQFVVAPLLSRASSHDAAEGQTAKVGARDTTKAPGPSAAARLANLQLLMSPPYEGGQRVYRGTPISIDLVNADIRDFVMVMGQATGVSFSLEPRVGGTVTIHADEMPWDALLVTVLVQNDLEYEVVANVVRIKPKER